MKQIILDMDGTFVDLYSVENWESRLRSNDPTPYLEAEPLVDVDLFVSLLSEYRALGGHVVICSWSAMNATKEYNKEVRKAKKEWCNKYNIPIDEFHVVKYGTKKHRPLKEKTDAILFDDNASVREQFTDEKSNRAAYDALEMLDIIQNIIDNFKNSNAQLAEEMIKRALENKIMAYCYEATDHEGKRFVKIGETTAGAKRIKQYYYTVNPRTSNSHKFYPKNKKYVVFFPCKTENEAYAMENILREYFLRKVDNLNTQYKPADRFYNIIPNVKDMLEEDSIIMQRYHALGY